MAHGQAYRPPPPPQQRQYPVQSQRELNVGYGVRHPEMMSPPARMTAPPPMAPRARAPMRAPPALPRPQQRQQQPQRRAPRAVATRPMPGFAPPPPPIPVLEEDDAPRRRLVPAAPAPAAAGVRQQASQTATAPSIARWLKPATLRQQFILTEVFQPPLAMREERLG
jgi:hypothetical protein